MQQMQQKHTILIIDDDCTELDILSTVLSTAGYRILVAEDGETGFNRAIFARPDLILLDVMMPGIDGYETCKRLRNNQRTQQIPIFFMTCLGSEEAIADGFQAGIDSFVAKPCNHDDLLGLITSRLTSNRSDYLETHLHVLA